jgi:murein DD-endopeptidase MepM/ murein hydrolase activator NlpD
MGVGSATLRIGILAAVGAATATCAVLLAGGHGAAALAAAPPPARTHPVARRVAVRRCLASAPHTTRIDAQLAHLVAPVTTARLVVPLRATPALGGAVRVFPFLAPYPAVTDTFGAARPGVSWHHGDDLFAARGTPVVAVANGVVFSVGWQRLGGRRLWLIDADGNEYYYAHLERYAALAHDGREVRAGEVLGYVGTTGDAEGTPPHLHFEIHPATLLHLGYDGAVDPTRYRNGWRRLSRATAASVASVCAR